MKYLSRLVVVIFAMGVSTAQADSITITDYNSLFRSVKDSNTYRFFQGGFDEGAFVTGFFRGVDSDNDGYIKYHVVCDTPTCEYPSDERGGARWTEVSDFALFFSGNSFVDPFLMTGLEVLNSSAYDDGDRDNGLVYRIGSGIIPSIAQDLEDCPREDGCGDTVLTAKEWDIFDFYDVRVGNGYTTPWGYSALPGEGYVPLTPGGGVDCRFFDNSCGSSSSDQYLRVHRVPEPGTLALLGIGLAGIGFSRRKKEV